MKNEVAKILTPSIIKRYEGQCVAILNGRVKYHGTNASLVLKQVHSSGKAQDFFFATIPLSSAILVK